MARSAAAAAARVFSSLGPRCGGRTRVTAAATAATATATATTTTYNPPRFLLQLQQHRRHPHRRLAQRQYCTLWRGRPQPRPSPALMPASRLPPFAAPAPFADKSTTSQSAYFKTNASGEKPAPTAPVSEVPGKGTDKRQVQPIGNATVYGMFVSPTRGAGLGYRAPSTSPAPNGSTPQPSTSSAPREPHLSLAAQKRTVCEHPSNPQAYTVTICVRPRNTFMSLNCPVGNQILSVSLGHLGYRNSKKRGFEPSYQLGVHMAQKIESRRLRVPFLEICLRGFGIGRDAAVRGFMSAISRPVVRLTDRTWVNWSGNPRPRRRQRK